MHTMTIRSDVAELEDEFEEREAEREEAVDMADFLSVEEALRITGMADEEREEAADAEMAAAEWWEFGQKEGGTHTLALAIHAATVGTCNLDALRGPAGKKARAQIMKTMGHKGEPCGITLVSDLVRKELGLPPECLAWMNLSIARECRSILGLTDGGRP